MLKTRIYIWSFRWKFIIIAKNCYKNYDKKGPKILIFLREMGGREFDAINYLDLTL